MKRILFVAHCFGGPGGTEQTMKRYANTCAALGYEVGVLADNLRINTGNFYTGPLHRNITVTNDANILLDQWDLIVVHGDGDTQNKVHMANVKLGGPIFYILCRPDENLPVLKTAMNKATWIGCATSYDFDFVTKHGHQDKIVNMIGYPIECPDIPNVDRTALGITSSRVFISCGGFWPHKRFEQIISSFIKINPPDTELILTGYTTRFGVPTINPSSGVNIKLFLSDTPSGIYQLMAIADLYIWNSLPTSEGFGMVLLECMFYNCPWIGTDTAGAHDLTGNGGKTYRTVEEMEELMRNPPTRLSSYDAIRLRKFVTDNYNTEYLLTKILGVL